MSGASDVAGAVADLPVRPRLAVDVAVHAPRSVGDPWVLERDGRQYYRVGPDLARLAELLTGEHDTAQLLGLLGRRWDEDGLHRSLVKLHGMSLIDDGRQRRATSRRVLLVPPMSVQLSVVDPSRLLRPVLPVIRLLGRRPAQLIAWSVVVGGLLALALVAGDVQRLVATPVSPAVLVLVTVASFAGIVVHELAHGATLMHFGARPRRLGVMLFYLCPAFFCDVSDAWLLSRRMQRVRVALAGIFAQLVWAGAAAVAGALLPDSTVRDGLLLLAVGTYLAALVNLVPFVKLDGYLALMAALDIPNLRTKAMADARSAVARVLYGVRPPRELAGSWVVPYGLACMVFPFYLIGGVAFRLWTQMTQGTGVLGALMVLAFLLGLVLAVGRGFLALQRTARAAGAGRPRLLLVALALAACGTGLLSVVHVTHEVPAYYQVQDGGARLLVPTSAGTDQVRPGQPVELRSNGLVLHTRVGTAVVAAGDGQPVRIPVADVLPVAVDTGVRLPVVAYPLEVQGQPEQVRGSARVVVGQQSLGGWLYSRFVAPATRFS